MKSMSNKRIWQPFTDAPPFNSQNERGEGVYFSGKRYTEMNTAERAAYRKSLIDDYVLQVEIND